MNTLALSEYTPARLEYRWCEETGSFRHNVERDLHSVAIWESARWREQDLLSVLHEAFTVLRVYEVQWSSQHVAANFNRLYQREPRSDRSRHDNVGSGPFLFVVLEDPEPDYIYWRNVSGLVELTNRRISVAKREMRAMVETGFKYHVHSTNSIEEFFRDAALILGLNRFEEQLQDPAPSSLEPQRLVQDMAGAGGWASPEEFFGVLRYAMRFTVLRGLGDAKRPIPADEGDVDVLCDDVAAFASTANALPRNPLSGNPRYSTRISGTEVKLDLRHVGDGDLDARWQERMLSRADDSDRPFLQPATDDRFFYLLYHVKLQKGYTKDEHGEVLRELAMALGVLPDAVTDILDDGTASSLLSGYLRANGYRIPAAIWPAVEVRQDFVKLVGKDLVGAPRKVRARLPLVDRAKRLVLAVPVLGDVLVRLKTRAASS